MDPGVLHIRRGDLCGCLQSARTVLHALALARYRKTAVEKEEDETL